MGSDPMPGADGVGSSILAADFARLGEVGRRSIDVSGRDIRLEVEGGIKVDNIRRVAAVGADTFGVGSAIFGKPDDKAVIDQLRLNLGLSAKMPRLHMFVSIHAQAQLERNLEELSPLPN